VANGNILLFGKVVNDQGIYMSANILLSPGAELEINQVVDSGTPAKSAGVFISTNTRGFNWMGNSVTQYTGYSSIGGGWADGSNVHQQYDTLALNGGGAGNPAKIVLTSGVMISANFITETLPGYVSVNKGKILTNILPIPTGTNSDAHIKELASSLTPSAYSDQPIYIAGNTVVIESGKIKNSGTYTPSARQIVWTWGSTGWTGIVETPAP
jgi:hypothetical protein